MEECNSVWEIVLSKQASKQTKLNLNLIALKVGNSTDELDKQIDQEAKAHTQKLIFSAILELVTHSVIL